MVSSVPSNPPLPDSAADSLTYFREEHFQGADQALFQEILSLKSTLRLLDEFKNQSIAGIAHVNNPGAFIGSRVHNRDLADHLK